MLEQTELRRIRPACAVGDNCNLQVLGEADDIFGEISAKQPFSETNLRMGYKNLHDLIVPCEFYDGPGDVAASYNPRFDPKAPSETQMFFYGFPLYSWQFRQLRRAMDEEGDTIRMEIVRDAAASPN